MHYNNPGEGLGQGFKYASGGNEIVLYVLECLFRCGVDVFILISGYFLCQNNKRGVSKPLSLIVMVISVNLLFYFYSVFAGNIAFSFHELCMELIPHNYFVTLYVTLYFFSPFINKIFVNFEWKNWKLFLVVILILFSVIPTMGDILIEVTHREWSGISTIGAKGSQAGYNIVNFALMYCIGAFIRMMEIDKLKIKGSTMMFCVILCIIITFIWSYFFFDNIAIVRTRSAWTYHNPLTILMAVLMFLVFSRINISSKIVNEVAKAAFACFLIHAHVITHLHIDKYVQQSIPVMICHIIVCMFSSYLVSYVFYKIYNMTIEKIIDKTIQKTLYY